MRTSVESMFPEDARRRIEEAVKEAELRTSGEIVPYVVRQSDQYEEAEWRGAALCALLVAGALAILHWTYWQWDPFTFSEAVVVVLLAAIVGLVLVQTNDSVKRRLAGARLIERRVTARAAEAFISEEVFLTKERTGILLFLSLLERRVLVVGDAGINKRVLPGEWDAIVKKIVDGISSASPADGLITGIRMSGELLQQHHVDRRQDDTDELTNGLRMGKT